MTLGPKDSSNQKIVFIDVDGTISDHQMGIHPATTDAIRSARQSSNLVYLCTGRAFADVPDEVLEIGFDGAVCNGGGTVIVGDDVLLDRTLAAEDAKRMLEYFDQAGIQYIAQTTGQTYRSPKYVEEMVRFIESHPDNEMAIHADQVADWVQHMPSVEESDLSDISKAAFVGLDPDLIEKTREALGESFYIVGGSLPIAAGISGEIGPAGISKGSGIDLVLETVGMTRDQAVGIGDSFNDVGMFEVCGTSVAMGNAEPDLKVMADMVTTNVTEGGVAKALDDLGLTG